MILILITNDVMSFVELKNGFVRFLAPTKRRFKLNFDDSKMKDKSVLG